MKIRDTCLEYRRGFINPSRTVTWPINIVDPVTEFKVHFRVMTHPTTGQAVDYPWPEPLPYTIQEIAIIDGSEVIFAMNGACIVAMSSFDLGYTPFHRHMERPGHTTHWCFPIHFGRSLVDPEWIFDPKKFRNPQLRITWDVEQLNPCGAGGYKVEEAEPLEIAIFAKIMEEGARPRGYLMTKEVKEYTPTGPGDETTYLPTDFPHRKLLVRTYGFMGRMGQYIDHIKISQDQDKWIPLDLNGDDVIRLMKSWFTEVQFHGKHWVGHQEWREHMGGWLNTGLVTPSENDIMVGQYQWNSNVFRTYVTTSGSAHPGRDDRQEVYQMNMTRTPFDSYCYPFGDQDDAADWLDVGAMGNLRLILTHGTEAQEPLYGITQIVCQQAHPY